MISPRFRRRVVVWLGGAVSLLVLGMAAELTRPYPDLAEVMENPGKYDGRRVPLLVECRVAAIVPGGFLLKQNAAVIFVRTSESGLQPGSYVVVDGVFRSPSTIEVSRVRVSNNRQVKMVISILPVVVVAVLLWRNVGFDRRTKELFVGETLHA